MEKAQMVTDETEEIGRKKNAEAESIVKLKKKVHQRDKRLRELKRETRNLVNELDDAYKELRRTQEELIIREKLVVAGGIASGIAHEMRNSLNIIGISVQYLHNKFIPGDERKEFTEAIMSKVEELNSVASDLIQFARPHEPDFEKINIHEIVEQVLSLVKFKCVAQKVKVVKKFAHKLPRVMVDKELMEKVFLNLIDNALWAMPDGGELMVAAGVLPGNNFIQIKIVDSGYGISRKNLPRIFDPFFTQRKDGTGLGLSIVHRIVEEHNGIIKVESEVGKGTSFWIKVPISQKK